MNIVIDPNEWMSDTQKLNENVVSRVTAYKEALLQAGITASDTRIMLKVADELDVTLTTVRRICIKSGVIEKKARRGRPSLTA